jgi:hypothetical protein
MNVHSQQTDGAPTGLSITLPTDFLEALSDQVAARVLEKIATALQPASPWMDVPGVAAYAVMTEQAVRDAEKNGHLRAHRTSTGRLRFHIDDVEAFLRRNPT